MAVTPAMCVGKADSCEALAAARAAACWAAMYDVRASVAANVGGLHMSAVRSGSPVWNGPCACDKRIGGRGLLGGGGPGGRQPLPSPLPYMATSRLVML